MPEKWVRRYRSPGIAQGWRLEIVAPLSVAADDPDTTDEFCVLWQIPLPNVRHKTMLDFLLVFHITRQMVCKEPLLIKEPPYQEWRHKYERNQPPVRAERKRRANEI